MQKVWYIIARKDESDVLRSLPQPDAKVGSKRTRKPGVISQRVSDQTHCKYNLMQKRGDLTDRHLNTPSRIFGKGKTDPIAKPQLEAYVPSMAA